MESGSGCLFIFFQSEITHQALKVDEKSLNGEKYIGQMQRMGMEA